jgi:hypothetical protein
MILFHHQAEIGCRGWSRTGIRAFKGRCPTIGRPGKKLVEAEVVATSPWSLGTRVGRRDALGPIKSPEKIQGCDSSVALSWI